MGPSFLALKAAAYLVDCIGTDTVLPAKDWTSQQAHEVHQEFRAMKLIVDDPALSSDVSFAVFPQEAATVRKMARQYRQAAIQIEILERIDRTPDQGSTEDYYPPSAVIGPPVVKPEFDRAVNQLREWNLVEGIAFWGGGLLRPKLTSDGHSVLDEEVSPQVWVKYNRQGYSMTTNFDTTQTFNGSVGAVQTGNHNTATVTQTIGLDAESFGTVLGQIRELIRAEELDDDTRDAAITQLDFIQQQAENGAPQGKVKAFFSMLLAALPTALAGELADLAGQAVSFLPA